MMKAILQTLRQDDQDPDYSTDDDTDEELRWSNWVSRWNKSMQILRMYRRPSKKAQFVNVIRVAVSLPISCGTFLSANSASILEEMTGIGGHPERRSFRERLASWWEKHGKNNMQWLIVVIDTRQGR